MLIFFQNTSKSNKIDLNVAYHVIVTSNLGEFDYVSKVITSISESFEQFMIF
jgi:hypothetical protein